MYLVTVPSATSWPKRASSDTIRGAPQVGFSRDVRRIRSRIFAFYGRASGFAGPRFPSPVQFETLPVPLDDRFRLNDGQSRPPVWPEAGKHDPEDAVAGT